MPTILNFLLLNFYFLRLISSEFTTYSVSSEEAELGPISGYGLTVDKHWLRLLDPPDLDYFYPVMLAKDFGIPLDNNEPLNTNLVIAEPHNACEKLKSKNPNFYKNKFVLAVRGTCSFVEKTLTIQKAGGRVALIYDNDANSQILISMGDDEEKKGKFVKITSYAMLYQDGKTIYEEVLYQRNALREKMFDTAGITRHNGNKLGTSGTGETEPSTKSPTPAKNFHPGQARPTPPVASKLFDKSKESSQIDKNFDMDSTLESDLKAKSGGTQKVFGKENLSKDEQNILEIVNAKKLETKLMSQFVAIAPMNVSGAHLMQPPWRVWHDEL